MSYVFLRLADKLLLFIRRLFSARSLLTLNKTYEANHIRESFNSSRFFMPGQ
jgi:hypothetical protein